MEYFLIFLSQSIPSADSRRTVLFKTGTCQFLANACTQAPVNRLEEAQETKSAGEKFG